MSHLFLTPRDWQAIAQREAIELLGTYECAAKVVEAKRYGALADRIAELDALSAGVYIAAARAEREACAAICDAVWRSHLSSEQLFDGPVSDGTARQAANAIRARAALHAPSAVGGEGAP